MFSGDADPALTARFQQSVDDGALVPEQVGLTHPALSNPLFARRYPDPLDDHGYVKVVVDTSRLPPTDPRQFAEFVAACEQAAAAGWDPQLSIDAHGGWRDETDVAPSR